MRIITGDECGLLKEIIPELCRPLPADGSTPTTPNRSSSANNVFRAVPSATMIQADASAMMQHDSKHNYLNNVAIQRLEPKEDAQSRERGVVSLSFVPLVNVGSNNGNNNSDDNDDDIDSSFGFAALRLNGTVETWSGTRSAIKKDAPVSAGDYRMNGSAAKVFDTDTSKEDNHSSDGKEDSTSDNDTDAEAEKKKNDNCKGWYFQPPIRPIGMASRSFTSSSDYGNGDHPILANCDSIGNVSLVHAHNLQKGVVSRYKAFESDPSETVLTYTKGRYANTSIATTLAMDGSGKRLAVGGRERGTRLLDVETGKLLWKAKNLPPNPQTLLQHPMWTTTIQFLNTPTNGNNSVAHSDLLATGTAYKQIQIYDIRSSSFTNNTPTNGPGGGATRRPVLYTPENLLTHRVTSICQLPDGNLLAAADASGDCYLLDMRKMQSGKQFSAQPNRKHKEEIGLGRLVGPGGSIRQLAMHPTLPILACVGLDRKLWTWDIHRRRMVDCVYLRQRLNCLLFCEDESWELEEEAYDANMADEDYDEGEWGNKRGRNIEDEEDEVEDYVDSDDDDGEKSDGDDSNDDAENGDLNEMKDGDKEQEVSDDDGESDPKDGDETEDESVEESPPPKKAKKGTNPKKRQKS